MLFNLAIVHNANHQMWVRKIGCSCYALDFKIVYMELKNGFA